MIEVQVVDRMSAASQLSGQVLAGGTLLMRQVNYEPQTIQKIIRITDPAFREITRQSNLLSIGAGVTMAQIINSVDLNALAPAARAIGGPAIRNMATVGGNLFAPHPYGDFTTALLALGAKVKWVDERVEDIDTFLANRTHARGVVAAILIEPPRGSSFRFAKVSRSKPKGVSVMSIAVSLQTSGMTVRSARIAFGAMGPSALRAKSSEAAIAGASLDQAGVAAACAACTNDLAPSDDSLASAWYRREVAPVHLRRLLLGER